MIVRPATLDDAAAIARLYVSTRRIAYAPFYPAEALAAMSVLEETERWCIRIQDPAWQTVLSVDSEDTPAGFVHYGHNDTMNAGTGEIEFLYVATQHQGTGLGKQLIALGEAGLAAMGFTTAVLWVYEGNTSARAFYDRRGWMPDSTRRESGSAPGQQVLRYTKALLSPLSEIGEGVRG
jgi:ribosomal protein S18 acetylase RimI-like enzyme